MRTPASSNREEFVSTPGPRRAFRLYPFSTILATGFGVGLSPVAPGTAGSAVALAFAWLLVRVLGPHAPSVPAAVGLLTSGLVFAAVGIPAATRASRGIGEADPGCVVVDEFAGQLLASAPLPLFAFSSSSRQTAAWVASFLLFRLFDVWKPGPIRKSQDLPEGMGIVIDDVLAGVLAAAVVSALAWVLGTR